MKIAKMGVGAVLVLLWAASAGAQTQPVKVTATRVSGAQTAKLRISLQNLTNKALEGVEVCWTFVTEDSSSSTPRRQFHDGDKTVDLKSLATLEFDSDLVEVARYNRGVQLRGHWLKVSSQGKTVFEEFNPQTIKKLVEQHQKEPDKKDSSGEP